MPPKRPRRGGQPADPMQTATPAAMTAGASARHWRGFILSRLLGTALSPITGFFAAIPLAFAGAKHERIQNHLSGLLGHYSQ